MIGVKNGIYSRGISICSASEKSGFTKAIGIQYAARRLLRAVKLRRIEQVINPMSSRHSVQDFSIVSHGEFMYKVAFNVKLTKHEEYIMTKVNNNGN